MSGLGFIAEEPKNICELCGETAETRPYGPNGERVCYPCGQKDPAACQRGFEKYVCGKETE